MEGCEGRLGQSYLPEIVAEKPAKPADSIAIAQIRAVTRTVHAAGGYDRFQQLLGLICEVGGLRRIKDPLDAKAAAQPTETKP